MPKPDFTGEWILSVEASVLSPVAAPVLQSVLCDSSEHPTGTGHGNMCAAAFALIASLAAHDRLEKIDIKALRKAYKEA